MNLGHHQEKKVRGTLPQVCFYSKITVLVQERTLEKTRQMPLLLSPSEEKLLVYCNPPYDPLASPSRAVHWFCMLNDIPHEVKVVETTTVLYKSALEK